MRTKRKAIVFLIKQIEIAKSLKEKPPENNDWRLWKTTTENVIRYIYGTQTDYLEKFNWCQSGMGFIPEDEYQEEKYRREKREYIEGLESSISLLEAMILEINKFGVRISRKNHTPSPSTEISAEGGIPGVFKVKGKRKREKQ